MGNLRIQAGSTKRPTQCGKMGKAQCGKFHDFSITQILREINFGDSRSAKTAIFIQLETFNFDFWKFQTCKCQNQPNIQKIKLLK